MLYTPSMGTPKAENVRAADRAISLFSEHIASSIFSKSYILFTWHACIVVNSIRCFARWVGGNSSPLYSGNSQSPDTNMHCNLD
jgi:hypothetical protein